MFHNVFAFFASLELQLAYLDDRISRLEGTIVPEIDDLRAAVSALVAEDAVIFTELDNLKAKADAAGNIPAADVTAATDAIKAEVAKMQDKMNALEPAPAPSPEPAPAPAPAPADQPPTA